jgi:hypothetical protein
MMLNSELTLRILQGEDSQTNIITIPILGIIQLEWSGVFDILSNLDFFFSFFIVVLEI